MPPTEIPAATATLAVEPIVFIEIGMVVFIVIFLIVVAWAVFKKPGHYRAAKRIPLEDQKVMTPRDGGDRTGNDNDDEDSSRSEKQA